MNKKPFWRLTAGEVLNMATVIGAIFWFGAGLDKRIAILEAHEVTQADTNRALATADKEMSSLLQKVTDNQNKLSENQRVLAALVRQEERTKLKE